MNLLILRSRLTAALIVASALLGACSNEGTVTVLPERPAVGLALPDELLNANVIVQDNLRPLVTLSNGATVSMQRGQGDSWSGTINVAPATNYLVTVTWVERLEEYGGRELPLAVLTQDLAVAADGTVVQSNTQGYSTDLDYDGDLKSNFAERESGSDPFVNNTEDNSGLPPVTPPANDDVPVVPDTPNVPSQPVTPPTSNPSTELPVDPIPTPEPEPEPEPDPDATSPAADVIVPRIAASDAPLIDGKGVTLGSQNQLTGEWSAAIQVNNSGAPLTINNLIVDVRADAADGTPHRRWAAMHDGEYLYVLVLVDDNGERYRDSPTYLFDDDSLEVFIDGDNSKSQTYGPDDFQRILPVQLAGADKQSANSGDVAGPNSSDAALLLDFATGPGNGPDGIRRIIYEQDVYEIRIQLESANINTDVPFGFELQVNDDDDGDTRDAKWAWKHPSGQGVNVDNTFINPSLMGTLVLE